MRSRLRSVLAALVCVSFAAACSSKPHRPDQALRAHSDDPGPPSVGTDSASRGLASWYGGKFQGRRTASGERFDSRQLTAAHRTLPFGSKVRVTSLRTGKSVVVRVNDRGPFSGHRLIDVSKEAARRLGILSDGVARVEIELLGAGG